MSDQELLKSNSQSNDLLQNIPPEVVGQVVIAVTETAQRVVEVREISAARRREVEDAITMLQAATQSRLERIEKLGELLPIILDRLPSESRVQLVDTICKLALGDIDG